jgi:hypothetical protein
VQFCTGFLFYFFFFFGADFLAGFVTFFAFAGTAFPFRDDVLGAAYFPAFFSGMAEIRARRVLLTCSAVVKTFATSGSITATSGASFLRNDLV